jgi:putative endonuclease
MASFFKMSHFVYILYSESLDMFYKGQTKDLSDRIKRHNMNQEKATQNGGPWALVWSTKKPTRSSAMILERKLKNLSRKRLIDFILKYPEGVEGPDDPDKIVGMSGC